MGCAPIATVLFSKIMNYDASKPKWVRAVNSFLRETTGEQGAAGAVRKGLHRQNV